MGYAFIRMARLAEHSEAILTERLGLSAERIADLRARKII
jgi:hypothetical protein